MRKPETIRWGLAGTGKIAQRFAADIGHADGAVLAAVCSRELGRAQSFAAKHPGVTAFGSLAELVGSEAVDAVYLATPNMAHRAQALACIAAGMPIMAEKPLAADFAEAMDIKAAAESASIFVMEALWSRYLPAVKAARAALRDGVIGKVRRLQAEIAWTVDYDPESRFFDKAQGGGALHDIGLYPISLARYFMGEPDTVDGSWQMAPSGVNMAADITLRFGQAEAEIACGFDRNGSNRMVVEGDRGVLILGPLFISPDGFAIYPSRRLADLAQPGGASLQARVRRKLFRHLPLPGVKRHHFGFAGSGLQFEIEAASNAIRQGLIEEPDNRLDDSLATLRIIDTILAKPPSAR